LLVTVVVLLILGVLSLSIGLTAYPPLDPFPRILLWGAAVGLALWLLFLVVATIIVRWQGSTYRVRQLARGAFIGLVMLGVGVTTLLNGLFDPHLLVNQKVVVVAKQKDHKRIRVIVKDWRAGKLAGTLVLDTSREVYSKLREGDGAVVVAGPGLFDWWYDHLRVP
jgi:hypothetical protein